MAVIEIGETDALTIIHDHATPASGVYIWYIKAKPEKGHERRAPLVNENIAAEVNLKEKFYDLTAVYRITGEHIRKQVDWENLRDALDYWEANNTRLYLDVQNEWGINLMTRATKADAKTLPMTQNAYRGKLENFIPFPKPNEVEVSIEFHYTTA